MTGNNGKKQDEGTNPVVAAVTGAVVGAAVVGAAGVAILANDESRKQAEKIIDNAKDTVADVKEAVEDKIAAGQEIVSDAVDAVKDSV